MPILRKSPNEKLKWFSRYVFVPPDVDPDAILPNGKLLDDETIKRLEGQLKKNGRYGKKELGVPYGIIKGKHGLYAIYNEVDKEGKIVQVEGGGGVGQNGKIKWAQNLSSGEWYALKTIKILPDEDFTKSNPEEYDVLNSFLEKIDEPFAIRDRNPATLANLETKDPKTKKINYLMPYEKGLSLLQLASTRNTKPNATIYAWPNLLWLEITLKFLQATRELHKKEIFHVDIKRDNYIYNIVDDTVVAVDFGSSCAHSANSNNFCLVPESYRAPELRQPEQTEFTYTEKTEVYALALSVELILFNSKVYKPQESKQPTEFWNRGEITTFSKDQTLLDFLAKMKAEKPEDRPELNECIKFFSRYLKQYKRAHPDEVAAVTNIKQAEKDREEQRLQAIGVIEELTTWEKIWKVVKVGLKLLLVAAVLSAAIYFSFGAASIVIPWISTFETLTALVIGKGIIFGALASIAGVVVGIWNLFTSCWPKKEAVDLDKGKTLGPALGAARDDTEKRSSAPSSSLMSDAKMTKSMPPVEGGQQEEKKEHDKTSSTIDISASSRAASSAGSSASEEQEHVQTISEFLGTPPARSPTNR